MCCTGRGRGTDGRAGNNKRLSLWNHGMGWAGFGGDGDSYGWMMELDPMVQGIKAGLEQSQAKGGPGKLDILGFDACLQASYAVVATVAPFASYIVGSEDLEPGHGWDYRGLKPALADPETFGKALIDQFMAYQTMDWDGEMVHQHPKTLTLIDAGKWGAASAAVDAVFAKLSEGLQARLKPALEAHRSAVAGASAMMGGFETQAGEHALVDLGGYLAGLAAAAAAGPGCAKLEALARAAGAAFDAAKVYERNLGQDQEGNAMGYTGLHVYLPKAKVIKKYGTPPDCEYMQPRREGAED